MEPNANSPGGESIEVSVVGSPEVFGGEHSSPGDTEPESNEQSIEKKDQSPSSVDVVVLDSGEIPSEVNIHEQLKMWQWVFIDGIQLPALSRGNELFLAVHNVQLRLLSRFPPGLSKEILNKYMMVSHRMTAMEAWTLNSINAVIRKCELGCQLFTPEDEVVLLRDVELFYWNIKVMNLNIMIQRYDEEIKKSHNNITLMAVITAIKQNVEQEIEEVKANIQRVENEFAAGSSFINQNVPSPIIVAPAEPLITDGKMNINVY